MATVIGTAGDDLLVGSDGADTLLGLGGDDTLLAGAGLDSIDGGAGTDRVVIDRSAATSAITLFMLAPGLVSTLAGTSVTGVEALSFTAGSGTDGLVGGAWDDSLAGGAGDDALQGGAGADTLMGGDGADTLLGGPGADLLLGGAGADRFILQGSGGLDSSLVATDRILDFNAAEGDRLVLRGEAIGAGLLALANRGFALSGQASRPVGFGGSLAPRAALAGGLGLPDPTGGLGLTLYWQPGTASGGWLLLDLDHDGILGNADLVVRLDLPPGQSITAASFIAGSFATLGTTAADALAGTAAADSLLGFDGDDSLAGLEGDDTLVGGAGNDSLLGGPGFDSLLGGEGADTLDGGDGIDVLDGGAGDDLLLGGAGDDLLLGGPGADWLRGGPGDDSLQGGFGADTLEGGAGADTILLQGMGEAAWSSLAAMDLVIGFNPAEGDRLKLSNAWSGNGNGSGADAGTYTGADGIARALVFSGSTGRALAAPGLGMGLPAQGNALGVLDAYQLYWVPALGGGGWVVLDLDRNARLDATDLVVRLDTVTGLAPEDVVAGTFLTLAGGFVIAGTAGDDNLRGGSLGETFLASTGRDRIAGGAGAGNALSYAALTGPIAVTFAGTAAGTTAKPGGGTDSFTGIQLLAGTDGADTLDAGAATGGLFALSLEGRAGADVLIGNGTTGVQLSYAASPAAISLDLLAGSGTDGWGSTDTLVDIRRVAATSVFGDTVLGSLGDDLFLSGTHGNKTFDGRLGTDEWRYVGEGAITVRLDTTTSGGFTLGPYVLKPGGTDRLSNIEVITGGAGDDSMIGSAADERFNGGAGNDTIHGGNGYDIVDYGGGGLASRGVVVNLATGTATDQWGGTDVLISIESAWGSALGDDLTGLDIRAYTWLRGQSGNDTLRAPTLGTLIGADYAGDPAGVFVDLGAGSARDGWGGTDVLVRIGVARGSAHADSLLGGSGAETLYGGDGADTLDGGTGADWLEGGPGDDLYDADDAADILVEYPGEGSDTVIATLSWGLGPDFEVLLLAEAAGAATGYGNAGDNRISGNASANVLDGGAGADTILGGAGDDTLFGGADDDLAEGEAGNDVLVGGTGADTLRGGEGDDAFVADADGRFTGTLLLDTGEATPRILWLNDFATFADSIDGGPGRDRWYGTAGRILLDLRLLPFAMISVEEVNGSAADDVLLLAPGQAAARINGGEGNDTLSGTDGGDELDGNLGDDLLAGQGGADTLYGGPGDDTLLGGAGDDLLLGFVGHNIMLGGAGDDTIYSYGWDILIDGGTGEDLAVIDRAAATASLLLASDRLTDGSGTTVLAGLERLSLIAGSGDDWLQGLAGADTLVGGAGNDRLEGMAGANALYGGLGDDTLVSTAWDAVLDGGDGQDLGILDRGFATTALSLDANWISDGRNATALIGLERLAVTGGAGADRLTGGAGADTLGGGDGDDVLAGGDGDDLLSGGPGANTLFGNAGDDTLVSTAWDTLLDGGSGQDLGILDRSGSLLALRLGAGGLTDGLATTRLLGLERLQVLGGAGADSLLGTAGADTLFGGGGDDTLDGGGGADRLAGGTGNDLYLVDRADDLVVEAAGEGRDTILASASYALPPDIEVLILASGAGDLFGIGNDLASVIMGNGGANLLLGMDGDDTLDGGAGDDTLLGGNGADLLRGGDGRDLLQGGAGNDSLVGGAGSDTLVGGTGNDTLDGASGLGEQDILYGNAGDDCYVVDSPADLVVENPGEGNDTVFADITGGGYALPPHVEALVLLGSTIFGIGNDLANAITGNAAANWLFGGAGNDTLDGRGGDDVLFGGAGADRFVFQPGCGADVIGDFTPGEDRLDLAARGFASLAAVRAAITDVAGGARIDFGQGDQVLLHGVAKSALLAGDFILG